MTILLISGSLNPKSRSRRLIREAERLLGESGVQTDLMDLRDYPLPLCDGSSAYNDPSLPEITERIAGADAVLIGVPVYTFTMNSALKNLVELTGSDAWENQVVGFLCAAGGRSSYMSVMGFANSLMLDFRSLIVPRFIYAVKSDFETGPDGQPVLTSEEIKTRIARLCEETLQVMKGKVTV